MADSSRGLVLWDIDGTILAGSEVVRDAYEYALMTCFGLNGRIPGILTAGMTDLQIVNEIMQFHSHSLIGDARALDAFALCYVNTLTERRELLQSSLRVLPGVRDVLALLEADGVPLSLLTGNMEPSARLKLTCVGLDHHFDFQIGGFGSDHHNRNALVSIVLEKCRQSRGSAPDPESVVVIGDTPRDILCARAGGARVLAVASGDYGPDELAAYNPDALLPGLNDVERALQLIQNILKDT